MFKRITLLLCALLIIVGVGVFLYSRAAALRATQLDHVGTLNGGVQPPPLLCDMVSLDTSKRIMTNRESQVVTATVARLSGTSDSQPCETDLRFIAVEFTVSPDPLVSIPVTIPAYKKSTTYSWIISAQLEGTYQIEVKTFFKAWFIGISVTNIFGWNAWQMQLYSTIFVVLGAVGGIGTIFGWFVKAYEWLRKKQEIGQESKSTKISTTQSGATKSAKATSRRSPGKPKRR